MKDEFTRGDAVPTPDSIWRRRSRVAMSLFFGVMTAALVVLWVRSYWRRDFSWSTGRWHSVVASNYGFLTLDLTRTSQAKSSYQSGIGAAAASQTVPRLYYSRYRDRIRIVMPHWVPAIVTAVLTAVIGWDRRSLRLHFNLRDLFLITTLIASLLGLAVWAGK